MIKYLVLLMASLWMVACSAHDERYYTLHPKFVQKAIENCSKNQANDLSCEQLEMIASHLNESAMKVQVNPQAFGKKILILQQTIASQTSELQKNPLQSELRQSLSKNRSELQEHLAIVKWLESPEG